VLAPKYFYDVALHGTALCCFEPVFAEVTFALNLDWGGEAEVNHAFLFKYNGLGFSGGFFMGIL